MVKIHDNWGDEWDERQRQEDEKRYYGRGSGGSDGYTSYPRSSNHKGRNIGIFLLVVIAGFGVVYFLNPFGFTMPLMDSNKMGRDEASLPEQCKEQPYITGCSSESKDDSFDGRTERVESDVPADSESETPFELSEPAPPPSIIIPMPANYDPGSNEDSLDYLREYAVSLINEDRGKKGISPVQLSDNGAAQRHAEEILATRQLSHWTTDGMKPYMAYTEYGGLGYVGQNAGIGGYYTDSLIENCRSGRYLCDDMDVSENIKELEHSMVYDDASSNWGHRDNILDPHHTHVSIGLAFDSYTFAMIQNFEDNYVEFDEPITDDNRHITLSGRLSEGQIYGIAIYYDPLPTPQLYEEHRDDAFYEMGIDAAAVAPPSYYYDSTINISASRWDTSGRSFDIQFDLRPAIREYDDGVYTITIWLDSDGEQFPVTSYSVVID